jgi:hypothetical protein
MAQAGNVLQQLFSIELRMKRPVLEFVLLGMAIFLGLLIAYVDSRPTWDDTGVTAGAIFITCAALAAASPRRPWRWALAIGLWIPLLAIATSRNYGALLALLFAFAGAYAGIAFRRLLAAAVRTP